MRCIQMRHIQMGYIQMRCVEGPTLITGQGIQIVTRWPLRVGYILNASKWLQDPLCCDLKGIRITEVRADSSASAYRRRWFADDGILSGSGQNESLTEKPPGELPIQQRQSIPNRDDAVAGGISLPGGLLSRFHLSCSATPEPPAPALLGLTPGPTAPARLNPTVCGALRVASRGRWPEGCKGFA